ncbi:MAG: site-specific integrase [Gammaproteobacteria bacterium]
MQRHASPRTIAAYCDSFRLLFAFAERKLRKRPAALLLEHLNTDLVLTFLRYSEMEHHNAVRSRNARFAAIRSFMHYTSALAITQPILAIPTKRF